jgi:hypothetical protein
MKYLRIALIFAMIFSGAKIASGYTEEDLQTALNGWNTAVSVLGSRAGGYCNILPPLLPMFDLTEAEMTTEEYQLFLNRLDQAVNAYEPVAETLSAIIAAGESIDAIRSALNAGGEEYVVYAAGTGFTVVIPEWSQEDRGAFLSVSGKEPVGASGERELPLLAAGRRSQGNTDPQFAAFGWGDLLGPLHDLFDFFHVLKAVRDWRQIENCQTNAEWDECIFLWQQCVSKLWEFGGNYAAFTYWANEEGKDWNATCRYTSINWDACQQRQIDTIAKCYFYTVSGGDGVISCQDCKNFYGQKPAQALTALCGAGLLPPESCPVGGGLDRPWREGKRHYRRTAESFRNAPECASLLTGP